MIVKAAEAERFLARLPDRIGAVLLFGPDQGLVRERAEQLAGTIVDDLRDPFRVAELDGSTLADDPARLAAEAAALSMTGGRRLVRVRSAGNALADVFEPFLARFEPGAFVVVEGGDLAKGSNLREVFEEAKNAAAVPCYLDSAETISNLVRSSLKAEGIAIDADALDEAVSLLGADRGTTRRELEKFLLYAHGQGRVTREDVRAIMGDEAEARIEDVCDAAGTGDADRLDLALERLWNAGVSPIGVLRVAMGHFQRLALAKTQSDKGESPDTIAKRMRPPLHFLRLGDFRVQLRSLSPERLGETLDLLLETEALCKSTGVPAEAACGRALFTVAAWARLPR
jgi:DNA polymerase-3 subunit delta